MKQSKRSKLLFLLNTIMVLLLVAIPVYGFVWNNLELGSQPKVEVGELDELDTIQVTGKWLDEGENKQLIPVGAIAIKANEVKELKYELTFTNSGNTEPTVIITVVPENSKLLATFDNNVKLSSGGTTVVITFTLPVDETVWNENNLSGNKNITITFELKD